MWHSKIWIDKHDVGEWKNGKQKTEKVEKIIEIKKANDNVSVFSCYTGGIGDGRKIKLSISDMKKLIKAKNTIYDVISNKVKIGSNDDEENVEISFKSNKYIFDLKLYTPSLDWGCGLDVLCRIKKTKKITNE